MTKSISSEQFAEKDAFINGSDCQRLERRLQRRFNKKLISIENNSQDLKEIGDYRHKRYRALIKALTDDATYNRLNKEKKKTFISYFIEKYNLFETRRPWIDSVYQTIENEKYFSNSDQFWKIPYHYFQIWYERVIHHSIPYHESFVLLAIIAIKNKYNPEQFHDDLPKPFIKLGEVLTGFSTNTVTKKIISLESLNVIESKRSGKYHEYQIKIKNWKEFVKRSTIKNPSSLILHQWNGALVDLNQYDEFQWLPYMYCLPFSSYNPLISYIHPDIIVHGSLFNPHVLLFSLFNKLQIEDLHRVWVTDRYRRSITDKYEKAKAHIVKKLAQTKAPQLTSHFEQIWRCWTILYYIAKRKRFVDRKILIDNIYLQSALELYTKNQLKELIVNQQIDQDHFWRSLRSDDFKKEWEKKYSIEELDPFYPVRDEIPALVRNNLETGIAQMYHDPIRRHQQAKKRYKELIAISNFLDDNNFESLMSNFHCLDIKTHRIMSRGFNIQGIQKENCMIVRAGKGKIFLLTDISNAELTILKWFIIKHQGVDPNDLMDLTFEDLAKRLRLTRDVIKSLSYPFLYGASIKTMIKETDQTESIVKRFRKVFLDYPGVKEFRQKARTYAKENGQSLPTALEHQFPIFGNPNTQSLSFVIQGTGGELLRAWILEVNKIGKAPEISNILHDEIIMEVEEKNVIKRISDVEECLQRAQERILPGIKITSKSTISNSWNKSRGVTFTDGVIGNPP